MTIREGVNAVADLSERSAMGRRRIGDASSGLPHEMREATFDRRTQQGAIRGKSASIRKQAFDQIKNSGFRAVR